jgi:hypothetical protein
MNEGDGKISSCDRSYSYQLPSANMSAHTEFRHGRSRCVCLADGIWLLRSGEVKIERKQETRWSSRNRSEVDKTRKEKKKDKQGDEQRKTSKGKEDHDLLVCGVLSVLLLSRCHKAICILQKVHLPYLGVSDTA